jgi:hypothetical protein
MSRRSPTQWGQQQTLSLLAALAKVDSIGAYVSHHKDISQMMRWVHGLSEQQLRSFSISLVEAVCRAAAAALPLIPHAEQWQCWLMLEAAWMVLSYYLEAMLELPEQWQQLPRLAVSKITAATGRQWHCHPL